MLIVPDLSQQGASMDLATAMALTLFGMFTGSTVLFFYKVGR
ncbi:UDP pyrophosphate phosphatase [Burkholderia thailandensis]|nr:UDP pyrophosphate phosphatase [Burkholderia thailandensis]AHI74341.1 putative membrane protein [Burkholderia thailandensis 2002721723]AHI80533.1 putative membrane protein [Burkholderia thailandensis E444]AIC88685.1 putative membrane protein [Burkholderia thailandensis USAMRU Malaysia \